MWKKIIKKRNSTQNHYHAWILLVRLVSKWGKAPNPKQIEKIRKSKPPSSTKQLGLSSGLQKIFLVIAAIAANRILLDENRTNLLDGRRAQIFWKHPKQAISLPTCSALQLIKSCNCYNRRLGKIKKDMWFTYQEFVTGPNRTTSKLSKRNNRLDVNKIEKNPKNDSQDEQYHWWIELESGAWSKIKVWT